MRSMPIALRADFAFSCFGNFRSKIYARRFLRYLFQETLNANNYRKNLQKSKIKERLLLENFQINPLILKI